MQYLKRLDRGTGSSRTRVIGGCEPPIVGTELRVSRDKEVLLTTEPSLQVLLTEKEKKKYTGVLLSCMSGYHAYAGT